MLGGRAALTTNACIFTEGATCVDDILMTGDDEAEVRRMVEYLLLGKYEGRDLRFPDKIIEISLQVTERGISLDQTYYAEGVVLERMGSTDARRVPTPLDAGMDLSVRRDVEGESNASRFSYARILGKIMFLAGIARPGISCCTRKLIVAELHRFV